MRRASRRVGKRYACIAPTSPSPRHYLLRYIFQERSAESRKNRERAITLAGDGPKPPTFNIPPTADPRNLAWCASTGWNDLSQRQLVILPEMLYNPDGTLRILE